MSVLVAKIAVSAATYWIDRPYDYLIPDELAGRAKPGMRVYVPFSAGNRRSEGVILALSDHSDYERLKPITALLDDAPVLDEEQIKLMERLIDAMEDDDDVQNVWHNWDQD